MEKSKVFDIINKINSVLFLFLLLGVGIVIIFGLVVSNNWQDRRAVQVVQHDDNEKQKIELILGRINSVKGHDVQYIELYSRASAGKFSSSAGGGETRNVLFFTGKNLESHWLYDKHNYLVNVFTVVNNDASPDLNEEKRLAKAIYIETIKEDTNGNGELDGDDLITISLAQPDGTNIKDIETGIQSVIDYDYLANDNSLILLFQKENKVIVKKYSLSTFKAESEKFINEISGKF